MKYMEFLRVLAGWGNRGGGVFSAGQMKAGCNFPALLKQRVVFLCGLFGGHDLGFNASAFEFAAQVLFRLHHAGATGSDDKNIRGGGNDFLNVGQGKGVSGVASPRMQDCFVR